MRVSTRVRGRKIGQLIIGRRLLRNLASVAVVAGFIYATARAPVATAITLGIVALVLTPVAIWRIRR